MKVLICTMAVVFIAVCVSGEGGFEQHMEECKTEAGITEDLKGKKPNFEDPKMKCFMTCMKKKMGAIGADGKVNEENVIKHLSKRQDLDEAKKNDVKACVTAANAMEGCEVGPALGKCLMEKGFFKKPDGKGDAPE